ncbi:MAG: DUF58 domain-containing protein [Dehalococcoidia bacterium]
MRLRRLLSRAASVSRLRVLVALLVLIALMALSTNYGLYYRVTYIFSLVLVVSYAWTWLNGRWIKASVDRNLHATSVGGWIEERLSIANHSRILPVGWVEVNQESNMPGHEGGMVISLPRASLGTWTLRTQCKQRGKFNLGRVGVVSSDPLGLFRIKRVLGEPTPFLVYPAMADLPNLSLPVSELPGEAAMRQFTRVATPSASGLRDYAPGDTLNQIHWKSTARMGKLMVKEFDLEQSTKLWLVLDMQRGVQAGEAAESTEEYGTTVAASVARKYLEAGLSVGLIAYGDREWVLKPNHGTGQLPLILESLALIRGEGSMRLEQVLAAEEYKFDRYSSIAVITPSTDESWVHSMRDLLQKRIKVSAILLEAQTFGSGDTILPLVGTLAAYQIPSCVVRKGDALGQALDLGHRRGMI